MDIKKIKELSNPIINFFNLLEKHINCENNITGNMFFECDNKNICPINTKIRILSEFIIEDKIHTRLCKEIKNNNKKDEEDTIC
jgi:hypothetical protein